MTRDMESLQLDGVDLIYKNFSGLVRGRYDSLGERKFSAKITDPAIADTVIGLGWNLRTRTDDSDEFQFWHLPVKVNYNSPVGPPVIWRVIPTLKKKLLLKPDTVDMLDYLPVMYADLIVNPYLWTVGGSSGISAYLDQMYVFVEESVLDLRYSDYSEDMDYVPEE